MKKLLISILILLAIFIAGCDSVDLSQVTEEDVNKVIYCGDLYMRHGSGCCLDMNDNNICDNDEKEENDLAPITGAATGVEEKETPKPKKSCKDVFTTCKDGEKYLTLKCDIDGNYINTGFTCDDVDEEEPTNQECEMITEKCKDGTLYAKYVCDKNGNLIPTGAECSDYVDKTEEKEEEIEIFDPIEIDVASATDDDGEITMGPSYECSYGKCTEICPGKLGYFPGNMVGDNNVFNGAIVVSDDVSSDENLASIIIATSLDGAVVIDAIKTASSLNPNVYQNMIVVGNACTNSVAADLLGNPSNCNEGIAEDSAIIKSFYGKGGTETVLFYGYDDAMTLVAAQVFSKRQNEVSGSETFIFGDNWQTAEVGCNGG